MGQGRGRVPRRPRSEAGNVGALIFDSPAEPADIEVEGEISKVGAVLNPPVAAQVSRQLPDSAYEFGSRAIARPYNPILWAQLLEKNTRYAACVDAMARNTVGLGWRVVPVKKLGGDTPPEVRAAVQEEARELEELFGNPNDEMPFTKLMKLVKTDEESTGTGYLEVTRNFAGKPASLHHVPSHTCWVDRLGGFIQQRNGQTRYFKSFGDQRDKDFETGRVGEPGSLPPERRATEIVNFKIYSPRDSFYGIPRVVSAAPAVTGNRLAAVRNAAFFENDAVPRLAILISGGHLSEKAGENIKSFLASDGKGPSRAHRVLVVEAEGKKVALGKQEPVRVSLEKLTVGETDDASFQQYRKANDDEIREAFRLGSIFLGTTEDVNRASAIASRKITIEQVFLPDQIEHEYVINHTIVRAMGARNVRFEFLRHRSTDPADTADADDIHARHGALTPNDIRQERGLDPYPPDAGYGDLPFDLAKLQFEAKLRKGADLVSSLIELRKSLAEEVRLRGGSRGRSALFSENGAGHRLGAGGA